MIERKKHRRVKVRCVSSRDLPVEDICVGLQFTSDHSRINMESHNSHGERYFSFVSKRGQSLMKSFLKDNHDKLIGA